MARSKGVVARTCDGTIKGETPASRIQSRRRRCSPRQRNLRPAPHRPPAALGPQRARPVLSLSRLSLSSSESLGSLRQRTLSPSGRITPVCSAFPFTRNTYRIPPTILISPPYPALFSCSICIHAVSCPLSCAISYISFARLHFRTLGERKSVTTAPPGLA